MPMRVKKPYKVITFSTTTEAMKMEELCMKEGIPGRLIPLPASISAGCGLSWRIGRDDYESFMKPIHELGVSFHSMHDVML